MKKTSEARRAFVRRVAYVAPLVLTFKVAPAFAKNGSIKRIAPAHAEKKH